MDYLITMTSPAYRMLRRLAPQTREYLVKQARQLASQPQLGEPLVGELRPFRSLHTTFRGTHYRIIYEVNARLKEIIVRGVGPRENLYKKLRRMKLKPLR